ncbi:MAG: erythromycin esterase family protein [Saprospiraceae bacterium]|nr:erythromycin esterase family protein [Saprospiraceae bacterium]
MKMLRPIVLHIWLAAVGIAFGPSCVHSQALSNKQLRFIKANAINIFPNTQYEQGNWEGVLDKIGDKRIVLLGELNHGSRDNFLVRNDLIRTLHKKAGFDVILFETGIGEAYAVDRMKSRISPKTMTYSLIGQWQTPAFEELMTFAKENDMSVAGFDVQRGFGGFFKSLLAIVCKELGIAVQDYTDLEDQFGIIKKEIANRKGVSPASRQRATALLTSYRELQLILRSALASGNRTNDHQFVLQTLDNRIDYMKYMLDFSNDRDYSRRWAARDRGMAQNVTWLLEEVYPDQKVIVVAHNFHISRFNKHEEVMGEFLLPQFGQAMFSVGAFLGEGSYEQNGEKALLAPDTHALDIKHIINACDHPVTFIDLKSKSARRSSWLRKKIIVNDSFLDLSGSNTLYLHKCFDGMILIEKSSPPTK